jgi:hypothetical protein
MLYEGYEVQVDLLLCWWGRSVTLGTSSLQEGQQSRQKSAAQE